MCPFRVRMLVLGALAVRALALDPSQPVNSYMHTRFAKEDGLPSGSLNVILQTRNGFLWVGTDGGLVRFDGTHFATIEFSSQTPMEGPWSALAEGREGDLWAGTSRGLLRIPSAALDQFGPLPSTSYDVGKKAAVITVLRVSGDGTVWAGTDNGLFRFDGRAFSTVISNRSISRIEEASNGHLLIVTSAGFVEWDGERVVEHPGLAARLGIPENKIYHVMEDQAGGRWYCTAAGVAREIHGAIERVQPYGMHVSAEAYRAYEDREGNVWLNLAGGLYRATATGLEPLPEHARYIYADRDGDLWLGSNGEGLVRLKDRKARMFTTDDGLPSNATLTVLTSSSGKLWVGSNCGLSMFDGFHFRSYAEKDGLKNACVYALAEDSKKDIWAGTFGGGVFRFHDGRFTQFSKPEGLPSDVVTGILPASDGSLWLATPDGVSHMQNGRFRNYTTADGLSSNHTVNLYQDRHGLIWAAMSSGLDRLFAGRFVAISHPPEARDYKVLMEDSSGGLYGVAAPRGIFRIEADRLIDVAKSPKVSGMLQFQQNLWLCGDGISRVAPGALRRWEHEHEWPQNYAHFGPGDGLVSTECSPHLPNLAVTNDGKLWAAMLGGLAMLDLRRLPRSDRKPTIYIQEIRVGQTLRPPGRELVVPPGPHHVELQFGAIELASPEKIHLQYRLDDDQEWLDAGAASSAIYSSFSVGKHRFHVRASNSDGVWDKAGIVYSIVQLPYFYETNIFRLAVFSIFGLLFVVAYRLRLRRLTAEMNGRLDERVLERTRLARELHDTLLQTIQGSKIIADTGLDDPSDAARLYHALERVSVWLAQATQEGRAALSALRTSTTQQNDLAEALKRAGENCILQNSMAFTLNVQGTAREMHPIVREEVYLVGYEAMRNACLHSKGTRLDVELSYARDLVIRVRDDGVGIDQGIVALGKEGHFGVSGMQERAERIGATLRFNSTSSGTEIELVVPGNLTFRHQKVASHGLLPKLRRLFHLRE